MVDGGGASPSEAVIVDVTARRAAEERSASARADLESTLAALPDLRFEVDDEGRIYDSRAPDPTLLAAPPSAFLGRTLAEVLPEATTRVIFGSTQRTPWREPNLGVLRTHPQ